MVETGVPERDRENATLLLLSQTFAGQRRRLSVVSLSAGVAKTTLAKPRGWRANVSCHTPERKRLCVYSALRHWDLPS